MVWIWGKIGPGVTYSFGTFEFETASLELRKLGRLVALEPQPARALALLVERAGETVSREELSARVWGAETHVDFNRGLAYCIGQIRGALGDRGDSSRFIQTVPKRGFRFIAPTTTKPAVAPSSVVTPIMPGGCTGPAGQFPVSWRPGRTALWVAALLLLAVLGAIFTDRVNSRSQRPIVAVSIFDNETGDVRYDRAVHNLSDAVVHRLTQLGPEQLGVIGNDAILRMPRSRRDLDEIRAETGASHVILAQLQPSNGGVTLLVHLIRLDDGTHLWTRRIPRPIDDLLEDLGDEAATAVESGLRQHVLADSASELK